MEAQARVILEEIRQLITQYCREVPSGRRAWPESVKTRVRKLIALGLSIAEVSKAAELSYYTILNWVPKEQRRRYGTRQRKEKGADGQFMPVAIRENRAIATVTVTKADKNQTALKSESATVTVTLPNGTRIEGVTPGFLRSWLGQGGIT